MVMLPTEAAACKPPYVSATHLAACSRMDVMATQLAIPDKHAHHAGCHAPSLVRLVAIALPCVSLQSEPACTTILPISTVEPVAVAVAVLYATHLSAASGHSYAG